MCKSNAFSRARLTGRCAPAAKGRGLFLAVVLVLCLPLITSAYTVVMSSGRRVEISESFNVTETALIYEASGGIRVTIWLKNVDVEATERANGEPAGSFMRRAGGGRSTALAVPQVPRATETAPSSRGKVITNQDLESFRRQRLTAEAADDSRRARQGLPSKEEARARAAEQDRKFVELARQIEERRAAEEYQQLQSEISSLRAQVYLLGAQTPQPTSGYAGYVPYPVYYPYPFYPTYVAPWPGFRFRFGRYPAPARNTFPPVFGQPAGASIIVRAGVSPGLPRVEPPPPPLGPAQHAPVRH